MKLNIRLGAYILFWYAEQSQTDEGFDTKNLFSRIGIFDYDKIDIYKLFKHKLSYIHYENKHITENYPLKRLK